MAKEKKQNVWAPFRFFVGSWEGTGEGCSGNSKVERHYEFVLSENFLQVRNKCTFKSQEKNPKGETHEDIGFFSYDSNRKKFVLRQFHVEGFINQYVLDGFADHDKTIVFVTESIENIPLGWRARETYRILNDDEFTEVFELAGPEKDFRVYTENRLRRKA